MRKVLLAAAIVALGLSVAMNASAYTKQAARADAQGAPYGLVTDCTLSSSNICAGWIWTFSEAVGAVWGTILDADDCPSGCANGGAVSSVTFYSRCTTAPGSFGGIGVSGVDAVGCLTSALYASGPMTVTHCVSGDRWTTINLATPPHVNHNAFAVTVTWGGPAGANNPSFATDNGIANLYCHNNPGTWGVFPGCAASTSDCTLWTMPTQHTYIYATDLNGDTVIDDFCTLYAQPYPLSFPYLYPYGYLPNNVLLSVGLDCSSPTATENTSWGHVKSLFE